MNTTEIDHVMNSYAASGEITGGTLCVFSGGEQIYKNSWGSDPHDAIYRMASISKVMTAVGFLKLYDRGLIGLDDEVRRYLPEFTNMQVVDDERISDDPGLLAAMFGEGTLPQIDIDHLHCVPAERPLTIRDLLTHSSGLGMKTYGILRQMQIMTPENFQDTLEMRVKRYAQSALDFQPGSDTGYSGTAGFDTLARTMEILTQMPFGMYMKQEVFDPLEMTDACYHPTDAQKSRVVPLYAWNQGNPVDMTHTDTDYDSLSAFGPAYESGSAGVWCTADDLCRFTQMLCNKGIYKDRRILKADTVRKMYTEHAAAYLEDASAPGYEWGLSVRVRQDPARAGSFASKGTFGWSGAFGTHLFISPADDIGACFIMNRYDMGGSESYISKKAEELVFRIFR